MPTIGEKNYNVDARGSVEVEKENVDWRVDSVSLYYDDKLNAYFAEVSVEIAYKVSNVSLRLQVPDASVDFEHIVDEASGLIDEIVYLRVAGVVRKSATSTHRSLVGVI